jgi:hypothetical protein
MPIANLQILIAIEEDAIVSQELQEAVLIVHSRVPMVQHQLRLAARLWSTMLMH